MPRPRPRLPPVTITQRGLLVVVGDIISSPAARKFAGGGYLEGRYEADRCGNLVTRQRLATKLENVVFQFDLLRTLPFRHETHVGDYDCAGDRVAL
jgi:hypothetical protein